MRQHRRVTTMLTALILMAGLVLGAGYPAAADDDKHGIEVRGTIVSIQADGRLFRLREGLRAAGHRIWVVQIHKRTRVEFDAQGVARRDDDDDDDDAAGGRRGHGQAAVSVRRLREGDVVRVEGRLVANGRLMASEIDIIRRGPRAAGHPGGTAAGDGRLTAPGQPRTGAGAPPVAAPGSQLATPQVLFPPHGSDIVASEFTIVGRTLPGAVIHIEVDAMAGALAVPIAAADITASDNGTFTYTVRPPVRAPGTAYRIKVLAKMNGLMSPTRTILVTQR